MMRRLVVALSILAATVDAQEKVEQISLPGDSGLVWSVFRPVGKPLLPGIIVLGGSEGGDSGRDEAKELAAAGYITASVAYFGASGVPSELKEIPIEYIQRAITRLTESGYARPGEIGVLATSKGSEAALLLASLDKRVKAVVAYAPSSVTWSCICSDAETSSWTYAGAPVAFIAQGRDPAYRPGPGEPMRPIVNYRHRLLTARNYSRAVIPIEKFRGALMIVAGRDDQLWPSAEMADQIRSRRSASRFAAKDRYLIYPRAGHQIGKAGLPQAESTRIAGGRIETGGTLAENALAQRDSWPRVLEFFAAHLQ